MHKLMLSAALLLTATTLTPLNAYEISAPEQPTRQERTAVKELTEYLKKISNGSVALNGNKDVVFYVGDTDFARRNGIEVSTLAEEEWVIKTIGNEGVILAGGGWRGTLYAVSHFLEDYLDVIWFNCDEESLPPAGPIELGDIDVNKRPYFRQRAIYRAGDLTRDGGRFAMHSRLNRDDPYTIDGAFGGAVEYGAPFHVHTFSWYINESKYFEDHPEYFALIDGKRVGGASSQLCLTNPDVRKIFKEKLRANILADEEKAKQLRTPAPLIYDLSTNDSFNPCQCDNCQAIVQREGNETGPLLDFINEIADDIKAFRPNIFVSTLAYQYTDTPPATIVPRNNVLIRLCDTRTNQAKSYMAPENKVYVDLLKSWAKITPNLSIWDYGITYTMTGMPFPYEYTLEDNFRIYAANHVQYFFIEHEYTTRADFYDQNIWIQAKLMENPYDDFEKLRTRFTDRYYGPAGQLMRDYRDLISDSVERTNSFVHWFSSPYQFKHLDLKTVTTAQKIFDSAEKLVANNPDYLRRVRRARLNLDRATYILHRPLLKEHLAKGGSIDHYPLNRAEALERAEAAWTDHINRFLVPSSRAYETYIMNKELETYKALTTSPGMETPEFFKGRHVAGDFTADATNFTSERLTAVVDPNSESGAAIKATLSDETPVLPLRTGILVRETDERTAVLEINQEDVTAPGYHWYYVGKLPVHPTTLLYTMNDWSLHFPLAPANDNLKKGKEYGVWISLKFVSPEMSYGKETDEKAIYFERVVVAEILPEDK